MEHFLIMKKSFLFRVYDPCQPEKLWTDFQPGFFSRAHIDFKTDFSRFHIKIDIFCEDFNKLDIGFNRKTASTMQHLSVFFLQYFSFFNNKASSIINSGLLKCLLFRAKNPD